MVASAQGQATNTEPKHPKASQTWENKFPYTCALYHKSSAARMLLRSLYRKLTNTIENKARVEPSGPSTILRTYVSMHLATGQPKHVGARHSKKGSRGPHVPGPGTMDSGHKVQDPWN